MQFSNRRNRRRAVVKLGTLLLTSTIFPEAILAARAAPATKISPVHSPAVNVRDFGATGNGLSNDSNAFSKALQLLSRKAIANRRLLIPDGTYVVGDLVISNGISIDGQSDRAVLIQSANSKYILSVNPHSGGDANPASNTKNIHIRNIQFSGWVDRRTFSEHIHLLNINACTGLVVENCTFSGFCGDGIYLGSSNQSGTERHNRNIVVRGCTFDGINGNNRNGISVIDCDGLVIEGCFFTNCSRKDMPGAIDIEPDDHKFHRVRNIVIRNNRISFCTGGVASISLYLPIHDYDLPPANIVIEGNHIDGNFGTNGISLRIAGDTRAADSLLDIRVTNNVIVNTLSPLIVGGIRGVLILQNILESSHQAVLVAHPSQGSCADITFTANQFLRLGQRSLNGVRVFSSKRVSFIRNEFRDCGPPNDGVGIALDVSEAIPVLPEIRQNRFEGGRSKRVALMLPPGIARNSWHSLTTTNMFSENIVPIK